MNPMLSYYLNLKILKEACVRIRDRYEQAGRQVMNSPDVDIQTRHQMAQVPNGIVEEASMFHKTLSNAKALLESPGELTPIDIPASYFGQLLESEARTVVDEMMSLAKIV